MCMGGYLVWDFYEGEMGFDIIGLFSEFSSNVGTLYEALGVCLGLFEA